MFDRRPGKSNRRFRKIGSKARGIGDDLRRVLLLWSFRFWVLWQVKACHPCLRFECAHLFAKVNFHVAVAEAPEIEQQFPSRLSQHQENDGDR